MFSFVFSFRQVAEGLADCIDDFLKRNKNKNKTENHETVPTLLDRFRRPPSFKWDGSKFYTNFQLARLDFGRSEGYRALFEHVDRSGGIFKYR